MRFGWLFVLLALVFVFAPILYRASALFGSMDRVYVNEAAERARATLEGRKEEVMRAIDKPAAALRQTARYPWMTEYLEAVRGDSPDLAELHRQAAENFEALHADMGAPRRAAVVDTSGRELIAMEQSGAKVHLVTDKDLLSPEEEAWLMDVVDARGREMCASPIMRRSDDTSRGFDAIPYVLVAQPLAVGNDVLAIAWAETQLKSVFDSLAQKTIGAKYYLVDEEQRFVLHPDKRYSKSFSAERGGRHGLKDDFPQSASRMVGRFSLAEPPDAPGRILVGDTIRYGGAGAGSPTLELIASISVKAALEDITQKKKAFNVTLIVSLALFTIVALVVSKRLIGDPLRETALALRTLRDGRTVEDLRISGWAATRELNEEIRRLGPSSVGRPSGRS